MDVFNIYIYFGYGSKREYFTWSFSTSSKRLYNVTEKEKPLKKKDSNNLSLFILRIYDKKNLLFVTKKMQKIFCFSSLSTSAKDSCARNFHIPAEISAEILNQISLKENGFKNHLSLVHLAEQISFRFIKSAECHFTLIFTSRPETITLDIFW